MANFAVIENNKVINIIVAETKEIAEQLTEKLCIEYTDSNPAYLNGSYNAANNKFTNPSEEPVSE